MRSLFTSIAVVFVAGCGGVVPDQRGEPVATTSSALTGNDVASLALANVGGSACGANSLGGHSFDSSCTGNGGLPEYWCADFARWVWENAGAGNTSELTAAAGSFYVYGQNHGTLTNTPAIGDAVVFDYQGGGVADHVALVTQVNSNGTIETVSGDWNGQSGSEAQFSSTSHVVLNSPAYPPTVGSSPGVMGMTISGFIAPVGIQSSDPYGANYVSQSFPLASTAMTMFAGQTLHESIDMKNTGTKTWDSSTRLGTTQPRDRASAFAAKGWIAPNRLAAVSGSVAPGGTYSFEFDLHAPSKPGTYLEYFNLVQEGVAWFSDPGQGGPPDNDLEANIVVVPGVRGNLDGADCAAIAGWSQDQASPATATSVDLYFDAPAGDAGAGALRVAADVNRTDLCKALGSCVHGFSVPPPEALLDGKAHSVYAYGIASSGGGPNELLDGGPKSFTCSKAAAPPGGAEGGAGAGEGSGAGTGAGAGAGEGAGANTGAGAGCSVSLAAVPGSGGWALPIGLAAVAVVVRAQRRPSRALAK